MLEMLKVDKNSINEILWVTVKADFSEEIINQLINFPYIVGVRVNISKEVNMQKVVNLIKHVNLFFPDKYIMIDFGGMKQRISIKNRKLDIYIGQEITFTTCLKRESSIDDNSYIQVSYEFMEYAKNNAKIGDIILISDGWQQFEILEISENLHCAALTSDPVYHNRGISIKGLYDYLPQNYNEDIQKLRTICEQGVKVDYVVLSFSKNTEEIIDVKEKIKDFCSKKFYAKIETFAGVVKCLELLKVCDGAMLGRGDLLVELSYDNYDILAIEDYIYKCCKLLGKEFVVATRIADSLETEKELTSAEVLTLYHEITNMKICTFLLSNETSFDSRKAVGNLKKVIDTIKLIETFSKI